MNLAVLLGMSPMFGYLFYGIWLKSYIDTRFHNAYLKELVAKQSDLIEIKVKREWNWLWIVAIVVLIFVAINDHWTTSLKSVLMGLIPWFFSLVEGVLLLGIAHIWNKLFSHKQSVKKKRKASKQVSPSLDEVIRKRLHLLYKDFLRANYKAAFDRFDQSKKSKAEFKEEIQNFLDQHGQDRFYLTSLEDGEPEITVSQLETNKCEAVLFLHDLRAQEFPEFYLICHVNYQDDQLLGLELVEIGY